MAKVKVAGNAVVITSTIPFEDMKKVEKCRKEALTLMGGENNKTPLFRIGTTDKGFWNSNSMAFDSASRDEEGFATLTITNIPLGDNPAQAVLEHLGGVLGYLAKIEAAIPGVLEEVRNEESAILASVDVLA